MLDLANGGILIYYLAETFIAVLVSNFGVLHLGYLFEKSYQC